MLRSFATFALLLPALTVPKDLTPFNASAARQSPEARDADRGAPEASACGSRVPFNRQPKAYASAARQSPEARDADPGAPEASACGSRVPPFNRQPKAYASAARQTPEARDANPGAPEASACGSCLGAELPSAPHVRLGINLAGPADWNTELPLVDVFRFSRPWISQRQGQPWGKGPPLALDPRGWVTRLEPGCWAETPLCTIEGGHYPSGRYTVLYEGEGTLEFGGAARLAEAEPGHVLIDVDSARGGIFLRVTRTVPENYLRNIRVLMPGFESSFAKEPWHPVFLQRWRGVACLRFMDFMETNNSRVEHWEDRPQLTDATWSHGVPLEMLCDLANRLEADPWFCMPHRADDEYVRRFAELTRERLDPRRKVYIEYSNEVWNGQFEQHRYAASQGQRLGLAEKSWEAAWRYTGHRSVEIFAIWEQVWGGRERLVRVLASQAVNPHVSREVLTSRQAHRHADALAIAPYFGMNVPAAEAQDVVALGLDGILDRVARQSLPKAIESMRAQKAVADEFQLALIAYEAGQHLVGVQGGENNDELTRLFHAANRHPRMGEFYRQYYAGWEAAGGELHCTFSSVSRWSKWGSWGLMQYYDDRPEDYPKYQATRAVLAP